MALIALEIEPDRIHVAAARSAARRTQIQDLFSFDVTGSDQDVAQTLKDHLSQHGLGRSDAVVVVNRGNAEIRLLDVPPAPDNELPEMVRFVARNEFASLNENWLLDYVRLTGDQSSTGQVLAAGVSPEVSNQIKTIVESAGLKLRHIALRPFAAPCLLKDRLRGDEIRLLIDPNGEQTDLSILHGTQMVATRTVRIPVNQEDHADKLIPEIKRTLASSSRAIGGKPVSEFVIFGDAVELDTLVERLRSRLDKDVTVVDPCKLPISGSKVAGAKDAARYVALMGALAQQTSGEVHPIDFLNPKRAKQKGSSKGKWLMYGGIAAAIALLATGFGWWTLDSQSKRIATQKERLQLLEDQNSGEMGNLSVDEQIAQVAKIDQWVTNRVDWQTELLEYSKRALTADETMVDSFAGSSPTAKIPGQINVILRSANFESEGKLVDSLQSRYAVKINDSDDESDVDKEYPIKSNFGLPLDDVNPGLLEVINSKADEYFKAQAQQRQQGQTADSKSQPSEDNPADTSDTDSTYQTTDN